MATRIWYALCRTPVLSEVNGQLSLGCWASRPRGWRTYSTVGAVTRTRACPDAGAVVVPGAVAAVAGPPSTVAATTVAVAATRMFLLLIITTPHSRLARNG